MVEHELVCYRWVFGSIVPEGWRYNEVIPVSNWDTDEDGCPYECGYPKGGWTKTRWGWELVFFPPPWENPEEWAMALLNDEQRTSLVSL